MEITLKKLTQNPENYPICTKDLHEKCQKMRFLVNRMMQNTGVEDQKYLTKFVAIHNQLHS